MAAAKKKPPVTRTKQQEQVNKKALIWTAVAFGIIVVAVAVMLILNI